jgi:hypothetical protein
MPVTRTLAAAIAAATLMAPSALARIDPPIHPAQPAVPHHLRTAGAPDDAWLPHGTQRDPRDLRVSRPPAQAPLSGPPTSPMHTKPISAPLTPAGQHDDGIDLATIGLGIAGGVLAVGTGIAGRNRRQQRRRATA